MLEAYREHAKERAEQGIPPLPLDAEQTAALVELLKSPPAGEEAFLLDLLSKRIPPGVDDAAYVKAAFLTDVAKGDASSPLVDASHALELLCVYVALLLTGPGSYALQLRRRRS